MSSLADDVRAYEEWLHKQCKVVKKGLDKKHERMREGPFPFLRATYFRWARTIESACPELADAPRVACIGDIHVENFGTWRDGDSRLVWGVNDFDEAAVMPYAYDLVRLTTSARLAPHLEVEPAEIARAILKGYSKGLLAPKPTLLDQRAQWLRPFAEGDAGANRKFWKEIDECADAKPPAAVRRALRRSLPAGAEVIRFAKRQTGGGSLGRPRYLVVAEWHSGGVVREAKALVPSAWEWAHGRKKRRCIFPTLAYGAHRAPDSELRFDNNWVIRRLAPDSRKLELADIERAGLSTKTLSAMGADLGAVHAAGKKSARIAEDLAARKPGWLHKAASAAEQMTQQDFDAHRSD